MIQQTIRTKVLIGIVAALAAIGVLLAHQLRVNQQAAAATQRLSDEREKAAKSIATTRPLFRRFANGTPRDKLALQNSNNSQNSLSPQRRTNR